MANKTDTREALEMPELDGVEHRFVELDGLRMHVAEAGSGDPVVLLHGFPQHWWEWRDVIPGLAERYRVICPDLRGSGWTDAPRKGYTREQIRADLVALVDALGLDRVDLVGHDFGAAVGFDFCLAHPERVRRYVSISIPHPYIRMSMRMLSDLKNDLWHQPVLTTPVLGPAVMRGQRFVRFLFRHHVVTDDALSERDLELFAAPFRQPARARAASATYRRYITPMTAYLMSGGFRRGPRLTVPTLLLYGAQDPVFTRPEEHVAPAEYADDLELAPIEGAAHFTVDEQPQAVLDAVLTYLARA